MTAAEVLTLIDKQVEPLKLKIAQLEKQVKPKHWYNLEEFCTLMGGISERTAYNMSSSRKVTTSNIGGLKFKVSDVDRLLKEKAKSSKRDLEIEGNARELKRRGKI